MMFMVLSLGLFANTGGLFKYTDNSGGGIVKDTAIYVYNVESEKIPKTPQQVKILMVSAQKKICSDETVSELIRQGLKVQYVYITDDRFVVVVIDKCE